MALWDRMGPQQCQGCGFTAPTEVDAEIHRLQCRHVPPEYVSRSIETLVGDLSWIPTKYRARRVRYLLAVAAKPLAVAEGYRRVETWVRERVYPEAFREAVARRATAQHHRADRQWLKTSDGRRLWCEPIDLRPELFRRWLINMTMSLALPKLEELLTTAQVDERDAGTWRQTTSGTRLDRDEPTRLLEREAARGHEERIRSILVDVRADVERGNIVLRDQDRPLFQVLLEVPDVSGAELQLVLGLRSPEAARQAKSRLLRTLAAHRATR